MTLEFPAYDTIAVEIADHVAHVILNRPEKRNAMSKAFWVEFPDAINRISNNAAARVIVVSSTGKHFTAGMDLAVFAEGANSIMGGETDPHIHADAFRTHLHHLQETFSSLYNARQPVLAAIQGGALGAGVDLSSACDMRYCTADAYFTIQEINIGMVADVGTFPRVMRQLPDGLVRELAYTGRKLEAAEALERGFVNQVYDSQEDMLTAVMALAQQIARNSPLAVTSSKHVMNYAADHTTEDTLRYLQALNGGILAHSHMMESAAAKMQKREPVYPDLKAVNGPWD
ncbi:MAG: enoyl-CoA hydratase-related protein [Alphaproteobacteria bacterium]|jgi:enoyl-CoA hydratase|nr:enoyl-CoA hydratase-related protein [Alphaproteobacteria bacterium]MDG1415814.1 enoyl-CoA hydratase-related protein [Alphaproteobacteria bacterium]